MKTINLAYVTQYDSSDIHSWSGLGFYIRDALLSADISISSVGGLSTSWCARMVGRGKKRFYENLRSQKYLHNRNVRVVRGYSKQVKAKIAAGDVDVVFSPGSIPIAYLETEMPMVFWGDATFAGMLDFYPEFTGLCEESIRAGNELEQLALDRCSLAIYASDWAAQTAIDNYRVDANKIKVIPFGANIECAPSRSEVDKIVAGKQFGKCKLLFLGVDWCRKGGDLVVDIAQELVDRGIDVELNVAGCEPPQSMPSFVKSHGFLSKSTKEGRERIRKLFYDAHFLVQPSVAECYGLVFAEASAYGVPSLAREVGGIPSVIREGVNGWMFSLEESASAYCDRLEKVFSSESEYRNLAFSSYEEYQQKLNWKVAGTQAKNLIERIVG